MKILKSKTGILSFTILLFLFGFKLFLAEGESTYSQLVLAAIGLVSSFVGTLAGGGGLITVPAMMLTGIPIQSSIATNKFSSGLAALSSVFYLLRHRKLPVRMILLTLAAASLGGAAGAFITSHIHESTMNGLAFFLLLFALVITLKEKKAPASSKQEFTRNLLSPYTPFFIAAYDGGFGPGSSTFSILYYMRRHFPYVQAVQLTRVLILGSCAGGFLVFYQTGFVQWPYAAALAIGSIIGSQIGLLVLPKVPYQTARILLIVITCLLIIQIAWKLS